MCKLIARVKTDVGFKLGLNLIFNCVLERPSACGQWHCLLAFVFEYLMDLFCRFGNECSDYETRTCKCHSTSWQDWQLSVCVGYSVFKTLVDVSSAQFYFLHSRLFAEGYFSTAIQYDLRVITTWEFVSQMVFMFHVKSYFANKVFFSAVEFYTVSHVSHEESNNHEASCCIDIF